MKKRVCHLTSAHARYDVRIFQKECSSLAHAGYEIYLVVNDDKEDEIKNGVTIISTGYIARSRIDRMLNAAKAVYRKALEVNADLYHFHDPELLPIGRKLKKKGKTVIFDSHEFTCKQIESKHYLPKVFRRPVAFLYRAYEENTIHRLDAVVVPCTYAGESFFAGKCKQEVLVDNLPKTEDVCLDAGSFSSRKKQACYAGSLSAERGVREIVQAAALKKIPLMLAGNFSTSGLKDEIVSRQDEKQLVYRGVLDREGLRGLLKESYMGLCVLQDIGQYKHLDNLPTKIYEYMGAGMPVVVSDFPYYRSIVEQHRCGICVRPDDVAGIAEAMEWLLRHPDDAEQMGKNGKKFVEEKANWAGEEEKLIKLYRKLFENK